LQRQYHESSREITGSYWALKGHLTTSQGDHWDPTGLSRDISQQAKGTIVFVYIYMYKYVCTPM
jgi:hypothetical protein